MTYHRSLYFLEMGMLLPFFPLLYWKGKKLRKQVVKLPPMSERLSLTASNASEKNLLILGESSAAGVGASSESHTFAGRLFECAEEKCNILNLGKNGLRAANLLKLLDKNADALVPSYDGLVLLIGANDCFKFTPPEKFAHQIQDSIDQLRKRFNIQKVWICTIPPVNQFPAIPALLQFFLCIHRELLSAELQKISKNDPNISFEHNRDVFSRDFFASDGIHPSDIGYQAMAKLTWERVSVEW